jgi:biotin-dependent carboxylase-like uncharacterized protein
MPGAAGVRVERPGALTTVQDAGRPGFAHLGVPRSGALDPAAHRLANRLVGNDETAPVLETTLTGVAVRMTGAVTVAVTGALAPVTVDGEPARWGAPVRLRSGQVLDVGRASAGVRSYLAISGGFEVPRTLGSASTDVLSGLGPPPLARGQILNTGQAAGRYPPAAGGPPGPAQAPLRGPFELPARMGPRDDRLTPQGRKALARATFTVAIASNRIGLRLEGPPVTGAAEAELPSEGLVWGAVQLLPDGNLVIFLADHPTTGGYPVIAVVDPAGFSACAQAAPGAAIRFRLLPPAR